MQEIAWKDENKNWQKIVIKKEWQQLSIAFVVIYLAALLVALATKFPLGGISILVLFLYVMGFWCVIAQSWNSYHYKINEVELVIFDGKRKAESVDISNITISSIKHFESFNVVHLVKDSRHYDVYISSESEEWEVLKFLWKLPATV